MIQTIQIQNQSFILHPSGVIFWEERNMLLIADLHLGKVSHFRKHGSAVPQNAIQKNFEQLDTVIHLFKPSRICFLGDLFHSYLNKEWELFESWITQKSAIEFILVVGNHDIISPHKYEEIGLKVASEILIYDFLLSHHPEKREGFYNFCGHIHPGVLLGGIGKQRLRLPCFYQSEHRLILPAFGEFTGNHMLEPIENTKIYAITQTEVILVHQ
ncbi:ligase-associated DNA damage response endonuclease PdeM [Aquimarina litoralis]|uniref:ligase-associated DNA damage response endonuclease PdeM n=1 Tax=Aquimarina litoralis TaxID=584605 RepID=UPI001C56989E|nr:ligase-associated DNA damage response endonuclease PdeM [Aquimarina litoralis]MBW1298516.1 ligase-associated DNA damage response endonuclease PdeM [Aquimarina litoralis]